MNNDPQYASSPRASLCYRFYLRVVQERCQWSVGMSHSCRRGLRQVSFVSWRKRRQWCWFKDPDDRCSIQPKEADLTAICAKTLVRHDKSSAHLNRGTRIAFSGVARRDW